MAGHQGLHRVVKTVKGKKGSTHRAYWVRNDQGPEAKPGMLRRAAGMAGKVALGVAAIGAAGYLAHRAGSHMAKWGGGGAGRGLAAHASLSAGAAAHALPARIHAATHAAHEGISRAGHAAMNTAHRAANAARNSSAAHAVSDHINTRKAAAHAARQSARHDNDMQELRLLKHSMGR